jgi:hypothetical protein
MQKVTVFALTLILIGVLYLGVALLAFRIYLNLPFYIVIIVATILAVFLALLCLRLRRDIQVFLDRIFYRETYQYRQTLRNFVLKMGTILNLDQLSWETLQTLSKAFRISPVVLLLEDRASGSFTTQFVYPNPQEKPDNELHLTSDNALVARLRKESHPLSMQNMENIVELKGISPVERDALGNLELLCPIKSHGKLVGIRGLGKKQSNNPYSTDDLQLVTETTNQAGVILENAILFQDIIRDANK